MNDTSNPQIAVEKARERHTKGNGQFETLTLDTAFPEAARDFAGKTVAQTREVYDRSKDALEAAVDTMEKSFDAAGQGAVALNRKIIDLAQRNLNSGFDLATNLAGARSLAEIMELQAAYWRKQFGALAAQAEEVRALSTKVTADTAEPIKAHVTSSMEELRKVSPRPSM
jgi:phasin